MSDSQEWSKKASDYEAVGNSMTRSPAAVLCSLALTHFRDGPPLGGVGGTQHLTHPIEAHDLACGPGILAKILLEEANPGELVVDASDFSEGMVDSTKKRLGDKLRKAFVADATNMKEQVEDNSYDLILSNFGLFLVPDVDAAAKEAFRTLRPGGLLGATIWAEDDPWGLELIRKMPSLLPDDKLAEAVKEKVKKFEAMMSLETFMEKLKAAGFENVEARRCNTSSVVAKPEPYVRVYLEMPVWNGLFKSMDEKSLELFVEAIVAHFELQSRHVAPLVANRSSFCVTCTKAI